MLQEFVITLIFFCLFVLQTSTFLKVYLVSNLIIVLTFYWDFYLHIVLLSVSVVKYHDQKAA